MKTPSWRDQELLSAYLDGQLSSRQRRRLEARLEQEAALRQALEELRQTRALLRRLPAREVPRNFTLTPHMVGLRPPLPRLALALRWAALTVLFLFFGSLAMPYFGAPRAAIPQAAMEAATPAPQILAAPPSPEQPAIAALPTETPNQTQRSLALASTPSAQGDEKVLPGGKQVGREEQSFQKARLALSNPVPILLLALAALFFGISLFLEWRRQRAFRRTFRSEWPGQ